MAGDWLKMDSSTPEKPEVLAITARMGWDDPDMTVGKLFRVWRWFDQHTTDGNAARVTAALLDRIAGVSGFAQAMQSEGWLIVSDDGLSLPKFDRHNGATAKARAQTAKRVASHRASEDSNADGNAPIVTPPLAREEKRREEEQEKEPTVLVGTAYRPPPSPNSEIIELYRTHLPQLPGVEVLNDTRKRAIACRWREVCSDGKLNREAGLEWFAWYFAHVAKSKFLTGQIPGKSGRVWQADFDFLMNASKFPRVVEGSYHKDTV